MLYCLTLASTAHQLEVTFLTACPRTRIAAQDGLFTTFNWPPVLSLLHAHLAHCLPSDAIAHRKSPKEKIGPVLVRGARFHLQFKTSSTIFWKRVVSKGQ